MLVQIPKDFCTDRLPSLMRIGQISRWFETQSFSVNLFQTPTQFRSCNIHIHSYVPTTNNIL